MSSLETLAAESENSIDSNEMEAVHHERREALRDTLEKAELKHKNAAKESVGELKQKAVNQAETSQPIGGRAERSPAEKRGIITKRHREQSFKKQMDSIQPHLSKSEQITSRIIHAKAVEQVSETAGATIARPNALLAGSISAFILVTAVYLIAKQYGYPLSGFETIGAFIVGWIIGLIYDYVRILIRGSSK